MTPTFATFNKVDQQNRVSLILDYGEFIVSRIYFGNKVQLYAMPGFYAEIVYNPIKHKIRDIRAMQTESNRVDKYLPYIKLTWPEFKKILEKD